MPCTGLLFETAVDSIAFLCSSPSSLVLLHCDLISESFYTEEHRGIIPYQTWSDQKKREKADEKKRRKEEYRRQEKAQASERKHGSAEVSNETRKELANTQSSDKPNAASPPQ